MSNTLPTGGPLNYLNEEYGCNSRINSVPVMALVQAHHPKTAEDLKKMIEEHTYNNCKCGIISNGPVEKFALNLFQGQLKCQKYKEAYPNQSVFSYQNCYNFMYTLFCIAPIQGYLQEEKSKHLMKSLFLKGGKEVDIIDATEEEDFKYAVDYLVKWNNNFVGIQVKPQSFFKKDGPLKINNEKHLKYKYPVKYHIYNNNNLEFNNERNNNELISFF